MKDHEDVMDKRKWDSPEEVLEVVLLKVLLGEVLQWRQQEARNKEKAEPCS
jgi:hypothetical protein